MARIPATAPRVLATFLLAAAVPAQDPAAAAPAAVPALPAWIQELGRLDFYGDFRLRHESSLDVPGLPDRHRQRLRLRFGVNYPVHDDVTLGVRAVTGDRGDPRSPHATLGDGFDGLEVSLDRAFVTWRPAAVPDTFLTAGKFDHPFTRNPVYGELLWDADVQPEGVALGGHCTALGIDRLGLTAAGYSLVERPDGAEALAAVLEASARHRLAEGTDGTLAFGWYGYSNPTPDGNRTLLNDNAGNATVDRDGDTRPDVFASDFSILHAQGAVTLPATGQPLTLAAEWFHNLRAEIPGDTGWAVGAAWGGTAAAGDWRAWYQFQVVERDAVFSPFAQDDLLLATNHRSHLLGVNHQLTDNIGLHLWGSASQLEAGPDDTRWRLRLDLNIRF